MKLAIDAWYLHHASPALDLRVVVALLQSMAGRHRTVLHRRVEAAVPAAATLGVTAAALMQFASPSAALSIGGLALLAWVHRLVFLRSNRDFAWPYTFFYEGDSETFYLYARALLEGRLYDEGVPFHPPVLMTRWGPSSRKYGALKPMSAVSNARPRP